MSWGKGVAYPLIGDKVYVVAKRQPPFDDGIWEVYWIRSGDGTVPRHYELTPWPPGRIEWDPTCRRNIWAYQHQITKLNALDRLVAALEDAD